MASFRDSAAEAGMLIAASIVASKAAVTPMAASLKIMMEDLWSARSSSGELHFCNSPARRSLINVVNGVVDVELTCWSYNFGSFDDRFEFAGFVIYHNDCRVLVQAIPNREPHFVPIFVVLRLDDSFGPFA